MPRKEIQFIGILANVDSSILKLDLEHNFKIEVKTYNEASGLLSKLEGTESNRIIGKIICLDYPCFSQEERIYLVKKTFGVNYDKFKKSLSNGELPKEIITFDNNYINNYLLPVFGKMRLFKEGNICMPLKYYFYYDNKKLEHLLSYHKGEYIGTKPKYSIENLEIIDLHKFIKDTKLPFKESTLQLAFENFDLSYNIQNEKLSFLALMISLETLVHPSDRGEVKWSGCQDQI